ncbi:hypothetical protein T05_7765, partial [Trichinella murrelli]
LLNQGVHHTLFRYQELELVSFPAHLLSYVPPGRSGSSSPVPAYSGSNPELQVSGLFQNHR